MGGWLSGDQLIQLADLAEEYGSGELRATIMQNIVLVNVPNARTTELVHALNRIGAAGGGLAVLAWRDCMHGNGILQTGDLGNEGVLEVADERDGGPASWRSISRSSCM